MEKRRYQTDICDIFQVEGKLSLQKIATYQLQADRDCQQMKVQEMDEKLRTSLERLNGLMKQMEGGEIANKAWVLEQWMNIEKNS